MTVYWAFIITGLVLTATLYGASLHHLFKTQSAIRDHLKPPPCEICQDNHFDAWLCFTSLDANDPVGCVVLPNTRKAREWLENNTDATYIAPQYHYPSVDGVKLRDQMEEAGLDVVH